ncbi:MAG: S8 family serine peptidase [Bacteroidota bacterium]
MRLNFYFLILALFSVSMAFSSLMAQQEIVIKNPPTFDYTLPPGVPCLKCDILSPKMSSELQVMWFMNDQEIDEATQKNWIAHDVMYASGKVRLQITTRNAFDPMLSELRAMGMTEMDQYQRVINGWVDIESVPAICDMADVLAVQAVHRPLMDIGSTTSQGDIAQESDDARTAFSVNGSGSKVGVLSDSYDNLVGASGGVTSGDLPGTGNPNGFTTAVQVVQDFAGGGSDEGRAMLEIVHDVAPGAELAFATASNGIASFATNILALETANCDVIVDDITYLTDAIFQDGLVAQAVDTVTARGSAYFSSAGNRGTQSYEGTWSSFGNFTIFSTSYNLFNFSTPAAPDFFQQIVLPAGSSGSIVLHWSNPYTSISGLPGPTSDVDLFILDAGLTGIVLSSTTVNTGGGDAFEFISYNNSGTTDTFNLAIGVLATDPIPTFVKTIMSDDNSEYVEFATNSSTLQSHHNAAGSIATGAAFWFQTPAFGTNPPVLETFSSRGGAPILFDGAGNAITPVIRNKPEITGPDGGNTTFFGQPLGDGDAFLNFFGTSAAAPHAAGVAALMRDLDPTVTPAQISTFMQNNAIDMGTAGFDFDSGFGLLDANATLTDLNSTLPVELLSLETEVLDNTVNVTWTSSDEVALSGYEVLLSLGGAAAETVGFVPARNITDQIQLYTFAQNNLAPGRYTVQLRSIDLDGTSQLSPKVNFEIGDVGLIFDFFSEEGILSVQPEFAVDREFVLTLWDIQGREIWRTDFNAQQVLRIHETELGSSQFLVYKIQAKNGTSNQRGKIAIQ